MGHIDVTAGHPPFSVFPVLPMSHERQLRLIMVTLQGIYLLHSSSEFAGLTSFTYITMFDIGRCVTHSLTSMIIVYIIFKAWLHVLFRFGCPSRHRVNSIPLGKLTICSNSPCPIGLISSYDRMNVLAVFSNTILILLAALTVLKHSMERIMQPPIVNTLVHEVFVNRILHTLSLVITFCCVFVWVLVYIYW